MGHVILLGDSIFDNAAYVPDRPAVIDQLRQALPKGWRATLLAIDGHIAGDVEGQLEDLPADATHLIVSAGGNDALSESSILMEPAASVGEALAIMHEVRGRFRNTYRAMLKALGARELPTAVCTIYDSIPGLGPAEQSAVAGFNEVILRDAFAARLPVIDLRLVCTQPADYSHISSIEPSFLGGAKIASAITGLVAGHDFGSERSAVYV
jgi:hypothetical protein